jgi:hypothetical protein
MEEKVLIAAKNEPAFAGKDKSSQKIIHFKL